MFDFNYVLNQCLIFIDDHMLNGGVTFTDQITTVNRMGGRDNRNRRDNRYGSGGGGHGGGGGWRDNRHQGHGGGRWGDRRGGGGGGGRKSIYLYILSHVVL